MRDANQLRIERSIARSRVILSIAAPLTVYLDPTEPIVTRLGGPVTGAAFFIDPHALVILLAHLAYSLTIYFAVVRSRASLRRVATVSMCGDVLFGAAVALVTEGTNSPFYVFFLFAVLATGLRGSFRAAWAVTAASLALYLTIILVVEPEGLGFYLVRAVYLAVTGYLASFLGLQRRTLASNLEGLTRSLHDGYAQTLAGVNLRVQTCRELIRRDRSDEAFAELTDLQVGVNREYDELRGLVRSLVGCDDASPARQAAAGETRFAVHAQFEAPLAIVEHALQIMIEGARNVSRHAQAESAVITAKTEDRQVLINIDDDGVGFPENGAPPWSIASRAAEVGGEVHIGVDDTPGGHVIVALPGS